MVKKVEKYTGSLGQNEKYGIKFNSNIPVSKEYYFVRDDEIYFINIGMWMMYDDKIPAHIRPIHAISEHDYQYFVKGHCDEI